MCHQFLNYESLTLTPVGLTELYLCTYADKLFCFAIQQVYSSEQLLTVIMVIMTTNAPFFPPKLRYHACIMLVNQILNQFQPNHVRFLD